MKRRDETEIFDHLIYIREGIDGLRQDIREITRRLTIVELEIAALHGGLTGVHGGFVGNLARCDRIDVRLECIERRLGIAPAFRG